VIYPNSNGFYWDDGRSTVGLPPDEGAVDDVGFLDALIDEVTSAHGIDSEQVYLTGMANGGTMAYTAACQMPERFAGVVVVSALMWEYQLDVCGDTPDTALNLLVLHGQDDATYYEEGRTFTGASGEWSTLSAEATRAFWAERNGCSADALQTYTDSTLLTYDDCDNDTVTAFQAISGGGNSWFRTGYRVNSDNQINATALAGAFLNQADDWQSLTVQDNAPQQTPRSFILYVPTSYTPDDPMPLVVLLHGRTASAVSQVYSSNMNAVAEREGFIALYPDAIDTEWSYGRGIAAYGGNMEDDEQFLHNLLDDIAQDVSVDNQRVYVAGLSNGGFMTQRLACTIQERFAAFASVAATAPYGIEQFCEGEDPAPILMIHGRDDRIVPWDGITRQTSAGRSVYFAAPVEQTVRFWQGHNGCGDDYLFETLPQVDEATTTNIYRARNCPDDAQVVLYEVEGGGHVWPGVRPVESDVLGTSTEDFNASEVIYEFFMDYELTDAPAERTPAAPQPTPEPSIEDVEQVRFIIEQLQTGEYTIFFRPGDAFLDTCDLQRDERARLREVGEVFETLDIPVGRIVSGDDCLARASAEIAFGEPDQVLTFDQGNLFLILARPAEESGNTVVLADGALLQQVGAQVNPNSASFIIQPRSEEGFAILTQVPFDGWQTLLALYQMGDDE
jgi:polyhydroxybutyrate depolymerase